MNSGDSNSVTLGGTTRLSNAIKRMTDAARARHRSKDSPFKSSSGPDPKKVAKCGDLRYNNRNKTTFKLASNSVRCI